LKFNVKFVIPAKAGIQMPLKTLDSRLHGNDEKRIGRKNPYFETGFSIILTFKAGIVRYVYYLASVFAYMSQVEKQKKERQLERSDK